MAAGPGEGVVGCGRLGAEVVGRVGNGAAGVCMGAEAAEECGRVGGELAPPGVPAMGRAVRGPGSIR